MYVYSPSQRNMKNYTYNIYTMSLTIYLSHSDMIETNKESDSRLAYQCIKLVVALSARCPLARDLLTQTQARWQWAVEWLRERMDDHSAVLSTTTSMSNEDSNTKNFQRTTSAQVNSYISSISVGILYPLQRLSLCTDLYTPSLLRLQTFTALIMEVWRPGKK